MLLIVCLPWLRSYQLTGKPIPRVLRSCSVDESLSGDFDACIAEVPLLFAEDVAGKVHAFAKSERLAKLPKLVYVYFEPTQRYIASRVDPDDPMASRNLSFDYLTVSGNPPTKIQAGSWA